MGNSVTGPGLPCTILQETYELADRRNVPSPKFINGRGVFTNAQVSGSILPPRNDCASEE